MGPASRLTSCVLAHARFRNLRPIEQMTPTNAIIAAIRARNPCDSGMVNNGLELMHKRSYVALRSVRQPVAADSNTIKFRKNSVPSAVGRGCKCILANDGCGWQPGTSNKFVTGGASADLSVVMGSSATSGRGFVLSATISRKVKSKNVG